jgi:hypothetical protein
VGLLIILRTRFREPAPFQLPYGRIIAVLGIAFCAWLLVTRTFSQMWIMLAIVVAGAAIYIVKTKSRSYRDLLFRK